MRGGLEGLPLDFFAVFELPSIKITMMVISGLKTEAIVSSFLVLIYPKYLILGRSGRYL